MEIQNPYPKDVFKWDNKEKLDFNRGRFNQHCFEIWENCKRDILKLIDELINGLDENKDCFNDIYWFLDNLKQKIKTEPKKVRR